MSAAMVVVVLHTVLLVVMVVAKVLFAPFQVHLQPLFSPLGDHLRNPSRLQNPKMLESYAARTVAPEHCSRP